MLLSQLICLCLFLICILDFSEAVTNYSMYKDMVNNIFSYNGWKNLNEVERVYFYKKDYFLKDVLEKSINFRNFDLKVRSATLILGCSYVKDLKIFYFICESFSIHCKTLKSQKYPKELVYDCTNKLMKITNEINSLLGLMLGALQALDSMHNCPSNDKNKNTLLYCHLFSTLQRKHDSLYDCPLSMDDLKNKLNRMFNYFHGNKALIDRNNKHCYYISYNLDVIWEEWTYDYKTISNKGETQYLFDYLSNKLHDQIKHILVNKFIKLGFQINLSSQNMTSSFPIQLLHSAINDEELKVASENRTAPVFIDFLKQELNPAESLSEPMEVDSETSTPFKFI